LTVSITATLLLHHKSTTFINTVYTLLEIFIIIFVRESLYLALTPQQAEQIAISRHNVKDVISVSLDCMYIKEQTPENDLFFTLCLHRDGVLIPNTFEEKKSKYIDIWESAAAKW
jgi:hypothetical protein